MCAATTTRIAVAPSQPSLLGTRGREIMPELRPLSLGMSHVAARDSELDACGFTNRPPNRSHGHGTTSKYYYYMWRFGWVFYLMAFVLAVLGLFSSLLAPCSRLVSGLSGLIIGASLFFFSIAAPLMT